jgi:hypothetical protein
VVKSKARANTPFAWQKHLKKQSKLALAALKATASFTAGGAESSSAPREVGQPTLIAGPRMSVKPAPVAAASADYGAATLYEDINVGREAREIGLAEKLGLAAATSPLTGFLS